MLVELPRGYRHEPGTWSRVLAMMPEPDCRYYWTATIWCPECGKALYAANHTIGADGQISPSLGHPDIYPACGWHTYPRLLDWAPSAWGRPTQSCSVSGSASIPRR